MTDLIETTVSSPVAQIIYTILSAIQPPSKVSFKVPKPKTEFLVLSYLDDFGYLWNINENATGGIIEWISSTIENAARNIVLVWDGVPRIRRQSVINIENYVTPYDWAVAISCLTFGSNFKGGDPFPARPGNHIPTPPLRILIIDLKSQEYSSAFAHEAFLSVGHALPWIQIYRPVQVENTEVAAALTSDDSSIPFLRTAILPGTLGTDTFLEDVAALEGRVLSMRQANEERDRAGVLNSLIELWRSNLVRPGDRHSVGNLLAPMMLAKALSKSLRIPAGRMISEINPQRLALKSLVEAIGLGKIRDSAINPALPEEGVLSSARKISNIFGRRDGINVLLIDDQYSLGFQHVLGYALFGKAYDPDKATEIDTAWEFKSVAGKLNCEIRVDSLLTELERNPPADAWTRPRLLRSCDVLILDLRLWTDKSGREKFLLRLIETCDRLRAHEIPDERIKSALSRAKEIVNRSGRPADGNGRESTEESEASEIDSLALMPLLISHYDPSLPIILFSSTHQRALIEAVSHRANIITDFSKPILTGYGEDMTPSELGRSLHRALMTAIELHESRLIWDRIVKTKWAVTPVFEIACPSPTNPNAMCVYNVLPGTNLRNNRFDGGELEPKLKSKATVLRKMLATYYYHYIVGQRYFDFSTIPWEVLEGELVPDAFLDDPNTANPKFALDTDFTRQNYVIELLKQVRNKKAHGRAPYPRKLSEEKEYRLAAIITFMFLLDYLNNVSSTLTINPADVLQMSDDLKKIYPHLQSNPNKLEPRVLTADRLVGWLDFVAYTACYSAQKAEQNGKSFLSNETFNAVSVAKGIVSARRSAAP